MRICAACGLSEPHVTFYPAGARCRKCTCEFVNANRRSKRLQYSQYEQRRSKTPERRKQMLEAQRRRRATHPDKNRARHAVGRAVRSGLLVRGPCEVCGTTANVQAHHDDYSKPLEVRWMCFKHHREAAHGQVVVAF